jgi:hypothetical protein
VTTPVQADDHRAALAAEYGKWVAVEPIDIGGARAFNVGDPVPVGHVESGVVSREAVRGVNTKAAAAVLNEKG